MIHANRAALIVVCVSLIACNCFADDLHVSPSGKDDSVGSATQPLKTIQRAISKADAGDRILVHAGMYQEFLTIDRSGNATDGPIVLTNFANDKVVLDGTGADEKDLLPLIAIHDQSFLTVSGLEICNLESKVLNETPTAILVSGKCTEITIENCEIHHIANVAKPDEGKQGRDAHGIAVFGDDSTPISKLKIRGNVLHHLTLGSSEALVVNGNVDGFEICKNVIHDCDNIGIDCIGFEGVSPRKETDQARNGLVSENHVYKIGTAKNPSYAGERTSAGIYVDGGKDIVIERNHVHDCDFGIEIASEKKGKLTQQIIVRNNILNKNTNAGLIIGGYNKNSTGDAKDCLIANNTFFNNDTDVEGDEWGQIHLQHRVTNCSFVNNILVHDIEKNGCNLFIVQWTKSGKNIAFRNNHFFGSASPVWVLQDQWMEGWEEYQKHEFSKDNELFGNPFLISPADGDFRLKSGSPAIDTGDSSGIADAQTDFAGNPRIEGKAVDRGAIELSKESQKRSQ